MFVLTIICLLLSLASASSLAGADAPEVDAFDRATKAFKDGFYERAEKEFSDFRAAYPQSPHLSEAVLLQIQAEVNLKKYDAAIDLADRSAATAGALADKFSFWKAEALFGRAENGGRDYGLAADAYGKVARDFPASALRLQGAYNEAYSRFKQKDFAQAVQLLSLPGSVFQQIAKTNLSDPAAGRGFLLLGESFLALNKLDEARTALAPLATARLQPEIAWEQQMLLARIELAGPQPDKALPFVSSAAALADQAQKPVLQAQTLNVQADVFKRLKQIDRAIQSYDKISAGEAIPGEQRRLALLKGVELLAAQSQWTNAVRRIEGYLEKNPRDTSPDLLRIKAGELWLEQFRAFVEAAPKPAPPSVRMNSTNLLQQARNHFGFIISQLTNSTYVGKAWLDLGWSLWEEGTAFNEPAAFQDSIAALQRAIEKLARSDDQALARLKLGDAHLAQGQFAPATTNYVAVLQNYADLPQIKNSLFERTYQQLARCYLELNDLPAAAKVVSEMRSAFPLSPLTEQTSFSYGQALLRQNRPLEARAVFADFLKAFPQSPLAAEVQLADARSYALQEDWQGAISRCTNWLNTHTNHALRGEAEFQRAWFYDRAGNVTNAFNLFTNYVVQFATNALAPAAQDWIANYYYDQEKWPLAEQNYQRVFQNTNWLGSDLAFRARLMAARTAFRRQGYSEARSYLTNLIADLSANKTAPQDLLPEAYFVYGDVLMEQPITGGTNALSNFSEAAKAFDFITKQFPTNGIAPLAWGKRGDCHLQLATEFPETSTKEAMASYTAVLNFKGEVPVIALNQADVGFALLLQKQAESKPPQEREVLLRQALDHLLNVVYGKNLAGRRPDPFYLKKAGRTAGRLAESLGDRSAAIQLYQRLIIELPSLRTFWESRIQTLERELQASTTPL